MRIAFAYFILLVNQLCKPFFSIADDIGRNAAHGCNKSPLDYQKAIIASADMLLYNNIAIKIAERLSQDGFVFNAHSYASPAGPMNRFDNRESWQLVEKFNCIFDFILGKAFPLWCIDTKFSQQSFESILVTEEGACDQ